MIEEIIAQGLLIEFEHDNRRWWHVTGWKHQLINRPSPSRYPRPPRNAPLPLAAGQGEPKGQENDASADDLHAETSAESLSTHVGLTDDSVSTHGVLTEHSLSTHGALTAGREGKGKEGKPIKPQAAAAIPSREVAAAAFGAENPDDAVRPAISEPDQEDALSARAIELTAMLRKRGANLQASDPRVRSWAANGVSDAQVLTALEVAQQRRADRGTSQPINAGLIGAILADANRATACRQTASETPYNPFAGAI